MAVRIGFIYLLFIILVSFGSIWGCDDCEIRVNGVCADCDGPCTTPVFGPTTAPSGGGGFGEDDLKPCAGQLIPFFDFCCTNQLHEAIGGCPTSGICCPDGTCGTDLASCPNIDLCPEDEPQPCGPICIDVNEICCFEGNNFGDFFCPESLPICCPLETFPDCVLSPDECCDGTGCI